MIRPYYMPEGDFTKAQQALIRFGQEVTQEAGALAMDLQRDATLSIKADQTVVTTADLAVQAHIEARIRSTFPTHQSLGEETLEEPRAHTPDLSLPTWVIDPIDGTDSYRRRLPSWTVSLGYLEQGQPSMGFVYHPVTQELFWAVRGVGAWCNDEPLRVRMQLPLHRDSMLLMTSSSHRYVENDFPGALRLYGCASAHLCFVAAGRVDAAVLAGVWLWDIVAGGLLVECAGGGLFEVGGAPLDWSVYCQQQGRAPILVASHPSLVSPVLATLQPKSRRSDARGGGPAGYQD